MTSPIVNNSDNLFLVLTPVYRPIGVTRLIAEPFEKIGYSWFLTSPNHSPILLMEALEAKGLAVAFLKDGDITWSKNYGYADVEAGTKVNDQTIFQIASISKPVTGVAVMQLSEKGLIDLDESVNRYLPFKIVNPNFPDKKITVRMLLRAD